MKSSSSCEHDAASAAAEEVDVYGEDGEEIDDYLRSSLDDIEEDINEYYASRDGGAGSDDGGGDLGSGNVGRDSSSKRLIVCSASIMLPFSEEIAFDAFSDLTRQP